jgi:RNA polymerase sigma factor (sigma-70 family)
MNKKKLLSNATLVVNYQKGDKRMISLLVKRWHVQFLNFAFWIVKDADLAKDIAQESWTIIIDKLANLKEPEKFKSWAISIVNRKSIDSIRTKKREQKKLQKLYHERETAYSAFDTDDNSAIKKALLKSIEKLSTEQQLVVNLFYVQSYSLKEISEILKISVGTGKSRLFHAREKLKKSLKHRNHEE